MAAASYSTVLPFPTKRKRPYPTAHLLAGTTPPKNVVRLQQPAQWVQVSGWVAYQLRRNEMVVL